MYRAENGRLHGPCIRVCVRAVWTARTRPRNGRVHVYTSTPAMCTVTLPCTRRVHGRVECSSCVHVHMYMACRGSCTRSVHGREYVYTCACTHIYVYTCRVHDRYAAMYTGRVHEYMARTRSCRRAVVHTGRVHVPCARIVHSRVHVRVQGPCRRRCTGRVGSRVHGL